MPRVRADVDGDTVAYDVPSPDCEPARGFTVAGGKVIRWCDTHGEYHCRTVEE